MNSSKKPTAIFDYETMYLCCLNLLELAQHVGRSLPRLIDHLQEIDHPQEREES